MFDSRFFKRGIAHQHSRWDDTGDGRGMNQTLRIIEDLLAPRVIGQAANQPAVTDAGDVTVNPSTGAFWVVNFDENGALAVFSYSGVKFRGHQIPDLQGDGVWVCNPSGTAWTYKAYSIDPGEAPPITFGALRALYPAQPVDIIHGEKIEVGGGNTGAAERTDVMLKRLLTEGGLQFRFFLDSADPNNRMLRLQVKIQAELPAAFANVNGASLLLGSILDCDGNPPLDQSNAPRDLNGLVL